MAKSHFHLIILGDSLAGRIAGALLAQGGLRVLQVRPPQPAEPETWLPSCLLLERLVEGLEGRSCFVPAEPLQVWTAQARVELHGPYSLADELQREFGAAAPAMATGLDRLRTLGVRLEEVIWEGGLPLLGTGSRWRFAWRRLRRRVPGWSTGQPLPRLLKSFGPAASAEWIATLFSGLAGIPAGRLTVGEAALLWSAVSRSDGIHPQGLLDLLDRRFEQFHGRTETLAKVREIEVKGKQIGSLTLSGAGVCAADHFLLAGPEAAGQLPALTAGVFSSPTAPPGRFALRPRRGCRGELLASRLLLGGKPPLRLAFSGAAGSVAGLLEGAGADHDPLDEETLRRRLEPVLPFVEYGLDPLPSPAVASGLEVLRAARSFPGAAAPMQLGGNLLLGHAPTILPRLEVLGEAAVGISAARHLKRVCRIGR